MGGHKLWRKIEDLLIPTVIGIQHIPDGLAAFLPRGQRQLLIGRPVRRASIPGAQTRQRGTDRENARDAPSQPREPPQQHNQHYRGQQKPSRRRLIEEAKKGVQENSGEAAEDVDGITGNNVAGTLQIPAHQLAQRNKHECEQAEDRHDHHNCGCKNHQGEPLVGK